MFILLDSSNGSSAEIFESVKYFKIANVDLCKVFLFQQQKNPVKISFWFSTIVIVLQVISKSLPLGSSDFGI